MNGCKRHTFRLDKSDFTTDQLHTELKDVIKLNEMRANSKGDSSRNKDTRLIDLDISVIQDTSTICDNIPKCTEYDTSQGTSNNLNTYLNQSSQDDTRFLSMVS